MSFKDHTNDRWEGCKGMAATAEYIPSEFYSYKSLKNSSEFIAQHTSSQTKRKLM